MKRKLLDPWGMGACGLSHRAALQRAAQLWKSSYDRVLILEDDVRASARFSVPLLLSAVQRLEHRYPAWQVLQLGGVMVERYGKTVSCGVAGWKRSGAVYQAHAYLVSPGAVEDLVARLDDGHTSDGAIVSLSRWKRCFLATPALFFQDSQMGSDTICDDCTERTWAAALKLESPRRGQLSEIERRGGVVSKKALSTLREGTGRLGGEVRAGGGSFVVVVQQKEQELNKFRRQHRRFPTKSEASGMSIGYSVWHRVCM